MPMTKQIHAKLVAMPAIPENPSSAAKSATIKNVTAKLIICVLQLVVEKNAGV
jgi:hypothetical protein